MSGSVDSVFLKVMAIRRDEGDAFDIVCPLVRFYRSLESGISRFGSYGGFGNLVAQKVDPNLPIEN